MPQSASLAIGADVGSVRVSRSGGRQVARQSVADLSLVAAPAWREAERRAAVIRPLAALPACPRGEARAAAEALGLSERQVYRLLRRCREGGGALTAHRPLSAPEIAQVEAQFFNL